MRASRTERKPTAVARTKLRKHARQIRGHAAAAHGRRVRHAVLVLAEIVPLTPRRVRQNRVCLDDQLELFLIAALTGRSRAPHPYQPTTPALRGRGSAPCPDGV
jgi:hypothetical protein